MNSNDPLAKAHRQNLLWPSVHGAVDVFHRRSLAGAGAYELIWRLIHIWEATVITLASAGAACLRDGDDGSESFRGVRERLFGMGLDDTGQVVKTGPGALDGSIDKWIEILNLISKLPEVDPDKFLGRLQRFLAMRRFEDSSGEAGLIDIGPLVRSWQVTCVVSSDIRADKVSALDAMRAVNSFRNRFAHVPFPFDRGDELQVALEMATHQFFEVQPATNPTSVLVGSFVSSGMSSRGGTFEMISDGSADERVSFAVEVRKGVPAASWSALPFVAHDGMMRWYVLTRLKNAAGVWEYTRYLAESNAVIELSDPGMLALLPQPNSTEYASADFESDAAEEGHDSPRSRRDSAMDKAVSALRARDFATAIPLLREYLKERPDYHIGWSRLGYSLREQAVEEASAGSRDQALVLLDEAVASFTQAAGHRDTYYQADAVYQRSKTRWRRWMIDRDGTDRADQLSASLEDAELAAQVWADSKFASWLEFLRDFELPQARDSELPT